MKLVAALTIPLGAGTDLWWRYRTGVSEGVLGVPLVSEDGPRRQDEEKRLLCRAMQPQKNVSWLA